MSREKYFEKEADLVASFIEGLNQSKTFVNDWTIYPESCGWDLLLAHKSGYQVGIEAKLSLNAKSLEQALSGSTSYWSLNGPDYRAVLVPTGAAQNHMLNIARALGIEILQHKPNQHRSWGSINLPDQGSDYSADKWPCWLPEERCVLPEYIPDVEAGISSPIQLTHWKIKAIKLMIVLERRGYVTRGDMKALQISPTRWTAGFHGFLERSEQGYIAGERTPDLRKQHPVNFLQIEADADKWLAELKIDVSRPEKQTQLFEQGVTA